ncbi:MAG: DNA polymerase III subunit chi [Hyphomonadaceae bacterium JAD_PAG50586_4]|nr:MAG: DNA polymerase III subunit chi [Hyphomonadaceae bacterium JAD_PAG50586_4]
MAELWFYHLERSELSRALAPLLEKSLQRGWRALVRGGSPERLDELDAVLWTYREDSFLPHAREGDPKRQPVWLTSEGGNPNGAQVLFLLDGAEPGDLSGFERACLMFDGRDEAALELARSRWKQAKADGIVASYWRESAGGKWEKQA